MAGICNPHETRVAELQAILKKYSPGQTIRSKEKRPKNPPKQTRIGIFGAPGVGKSAFINSLLYVTGESWNHEAPEGYVEQQSTTMKRDAYDLTDHLVVCDNRGMVEFSQKFMGEVEYQIEGVRRDGEHVVWDKGRVERLVAYLNSLRTSKSTNKLSEIHCAVIVVSGENLLVKAADLADLVQTIRRMTGIMFDDCKP
ncbi:uncharacterized protein LOC100891991 [Strongylocentrotus purpuratus]|uniref:G domain-containing protein n=1 Tax=Strongylocentrotus purpuratus TaxID=7668 RepID=A0A7M7T1G7_STRPU|nr:uncharacterized protein LOC100891991 [Strongylocentrotus purpuratus]